ncbi:transcription factor TFIIIC subunit tfc4, partial [Coemansia sp. RSA 2618]
MDRYPAYDDMLSDDGGMHSQVYSLANDDTALLDAVRSAAEMLAAEGLGNMVNIDSIQRQSLAQHAGTDNEYTTGAEQTDNEYTTEFEQTEDEIDDSSWMQPLSQTPNRPLLRGRRAKRVSYAEPGHLSDGLPYIDDDDEDSTFSASDRSGSSNDDYHMEEIEQMMHETSGIKQRKKKKGKKGKKGMNEGQSGAGTVKKQRKRKYDKSQRYNIDVQRLLGVANGWYVEQELERAFTVLCDVIHIDANCASAWRTMALIRDEQGKPADALQLYTVAAHLATYDNTLWEQLYTMHMQIAEEKAQLVQAHDKAALEAYDEAITHALECLKYIVTNNPKNTDAWTRRLSIMEAREDYSGMARSYRTLLRTKPHDMQLIRDASILFAKRRDDLERPIAWFEAAIAFYNKQAVDLAEQAAVQARRRALTEQFPDGSGADQSVDLGADSGEDEEREFGEIDDEWADYFLANPDKTVPMEDLGGYSYNDLNMLAELRLLRREYETGIVEIKRGARFVQGRGREMNWVDSELADDEDAEYPISEDGGDRGLPIELRIKLGQFRLLLGHEEAAKQHIDVLYTLDVAGYEDLYTDVAEAYTDVGHSELAIEIFQTLVARDETNQPSVWERLAKCYREQGDMDNACRYALEVAKADPSDIDIRLWLAEVYEDMGSVDLAFKMISDVEEIQQTERSRAEADAQRTGADTDPHAAARRASAYASRRRKTSDEERRRCLAAMRTAEVIFKKLELLMPLIEPGGSAEAISEFCESAQQMYSDWRHTRAFYPSDRMRPFRRYRTVTQTNLENDVQEEGGIALDATGSSQASVQRQMDRMKRRLSRKQRSKAGDSTHDDDDQLHTLAPPTTFRSISFARWFDMFLMFAKCLTLDTGSYGGAEAALDMLDTVSQSNIFLHDAERKRTLRLAMLAIAVHAEMFDRLYEQVRWWCGPRPNSAIAYKLFAFAMASSSAATSMLTSSNVYKFIRRQLEFVDDLYYAARAEPASVPVGSAQLPFSDSDADDDGCSVAVPVAADQRQLAKSDLAALHSLAAHVMLLARTNATSIVQYTMALSMCPQDASIALHLGVAYLRQATRRGDPSPQATVLRAMTYIERYAELKCIEEMRAAGSWPAAPRGVPHNTVVTQEIAYNFARTFHFLGMLDLACSYYRRVFELPVSLNAATGTDADIAICDLRAEAAYNLASIYIASGA